MKKAIITLAILLMFIHQYSFGLSIMRPPESKPIAVEYPGPTKTVSRNIYLKQLKRDIDQFTQNVDQALQKKATVHDAAQLEQINKYITNQRHMRDVLVEQRDNIERKNYIAVKAF